MSHRPGKTLKAVVELPRDPARCWKWLGRIDPNGYGRKNYLGESMTCRRWIWSLLFGPVPHGMTITSTCGNKQCCNPYHLRCCSMEDAQRAGTSASLLPSDVAELRKLKKKGRKLPAGERAVLAEKYGVCEHTISSVIYGRSWKRAKRKTSDGVVEGNPKSASG